MSSPVLIVCDIEWHTELVAPQAGKFVEKRASTYQGLRDQSYKLRSLLWCQTDGRTFSKQPISQRAFLSYDNREDVIDEHEG